jgi:nitrite reductase/ring-hydroxylating ferredoxin subunit
VVVATHLSFLDRGLYFARCHPERSYVVAGRVSDPPRGMYLSTESPAHSIRAHGEWLLVGGESHKTGQADEAERYERLASWARERFGLEAELRWATQDQIPADSVPYVGRHDPFSAGLWVATGFNKWGLAMGTAAAELLAAQIDGREHPWSRLFDPNRVRPRASAPSLVKENANVALRFVGDRVTKRGAPRCTHMGCLLSWNAAESTWDCPCHGSRFAETGEVIEGPATRPLRSPPPPG